MKKTIVIALAIAASFCTAATIEQNVQALEQATRAIEAAIQAKGKTPTGGLNAAADDILAIPDKIKYDHDYVAQSNSIAVVEKAITNHTYYLVEWLHCEKQANRWIDLKARANQSTCVEIGVSNILDTTFSNTFGDTGDWGNQKFCFTIYQNRTSFGYDGSWYEPGNSIPSKTRTMVFKMDGNKIYIDGELVQTMSTSTFVTKYNLYALNRNSDELSDSSKSFAGKLLWIDLKGALGTDGTTAVPDMAFRPAVDEYSRPCLIDILASPVQPYYLNQGTVSVSSPTGTVYDITPIRYDIQLQMPYETNVVGAADNALIINDATQFLYDRMAAQTEEHE